MGYKQGIEAIRKEKDKFMKHAPNSPLTEDQKETFPGLNYFSINPHFRVEGTRNEYKDKPEIELEYTKGVLKTQVVFGQFSFKIDDQSLSLEIFQVQDGYLLAPFADVTSDKETYSGGRYGLLEKIEAGQWILDFNKASNLICAYNETCVCTLVPPINRLSVRIEAGEKVFHD